MCKPIALLLTLRCVLPAPGAAQTPTSATAPQDSAPASTAPTTDVFDLVRRLRHKQPDPAEAWDYRKPMKAVSPVIGSKPSSGALFGVAGNVAFYRGDPATTHISSAVAGLTFSTKGQTSLTDRFTMFANHDRWRLDADHRFQWTSLDTYGLGTSADTHTGVVAKFDFFRLHHTGVLPASPTPVCRRRPVLRQPHERRTSGRRGGRMAAVTLR